MRALLKVPYPFCAMDISEIDVTEEYSECVWRETLLMLPVFLRLPRTEERGLNRTGLMVIFMHSVERQKQSQVQSDRNPVRQENTIRILWSTLICRLEEDGLGDQCCGIRASTSVFEDRIPIGACSKPFQSISLTMSLRKQQKMVQVLGVLVPYGRPGRNSSPGS